MPSTRLRISTRLVRVLKAVRIAGGSLGLLLLFCLPGLAQTDTGRILGNVTDQTGAAIKGASVTITDTLRGTTRTLTTDDAGAYVAPGLLPSTYKVRAGATGFKVVERPSIQLEVAKDALIDFSLPPGQASETITVTDEVSQVETTNDILGGTISNAQINEMPLNGRDFLNLVVLRPGIQRYPGGGHYSVSSNGVRPEDNNFIVDGFDSNDPYGAQSVINGVGVQGSPATILPIDSIQEFNVEENPPAEYGWKPGAIVNIGLKSGTNGLHGTVYGFERNSALDARNWFNKAGTPQTPLRLHQFGATVGGPVIKDKLFFFGGFEGIHDLVGNSFSLSSPATTSLPDAGNCPEGVTGDCANSIPDAILGVQAAGLPISPVGQSLANLFPTNTTGTPNIVLGFPNTNNGNNGLAKIDYHISERNTLSGLYFIGGSTQFESDQAVLNPAWISEAQTRSQVFGVNWTWTPRPTWVNQAKFAYTRQRQFITTADSTVNPTTYGINTGVTTPRDFGMPVIIVGGFYPLGGNPGFPSLQNPALNYQFADTVSYARGNHAFKFGGELRRASINNIKDRYGKSRVRFGGHAAAFDGATPLEDLLAGFPRDGRIAVGNTQRHVHMWSYAGFFQDDWRISPRFTANLGVRYELTTVMKEDHNLLGNFDPNIGLVQVGQQIKSPYNGDHNNWAPRVGLAWDVTGKGKTVLRAGGGIVYEIPPFNTFIGYFGVANSSTPGISVIPTGAAGVQPGGGTIVAGAVDTKLTASDLNPGPVFTVSNLDCLNTPCSILGVKRDLRTPYVSSWNLNLQQAITDSLSLQIGYVGNHGTKLYSVYDINQVNPQDPAEIAAQASGCPIPNTCEQVGRPFSAKFPFLKFINQLGNGYKSSYNGLQATLTQRTKHGLSFIVGYTWSHALDQLSANRDPQPQNSLNPASEYGNSDLNVPQRLTFTMTYDIPGRKGFAQMMEGWQINSIVTLQSGQPWSAIDGQQNGSDISLTGELGDRWDFFGKPSDFSPSPNGPIPFFADGTTNALCVAHAAPNSPLSSLGCYQKGNSVLTPPAPGTFGTAGRNIFTGPHFRDWDLSLVKSWKFGERLTTQFRGEFFNVLNHPNFANPWGASGTYAFVDPSAPASFGFAGATPDVAGANPVIGTGGARAIQLGLKFIF
jgi:hypothetical protein